jgi:hypothetical protein
LGHALLRVLVRVRGRVFIRFAIMFDRGGAYGFVNFPMLLLTVLVAVGDSLARRTCLERVLGSLDCVAL